MCTYRDNWISWGGVVCASYRNELGVSSEVVVAVSQNACDTGNMMLNKCSA